MVSMAFLSFPVAVFLLPAFLSVPVSVMLVPLLSVVIYPSFEVDDSGSALSPSAVRMI